MDKKTRNNTIIMGIFWVGIFCIGLSGIIGEQDVNSGVSITPQLGPAGGNVVFTAVDAGTQAPIEGVAYYINDKFAGSSGADGLFVLSSGTYPSGMVMIRASKPGYRNQVREIDLGGVSSIDMEFEPSTIYPIRVSGSSDAKIDIVFMPSDTSFNATTKEKIRNNGYPGGREQFEADVSRFINRTFKAYPGLLAASTSGTGDYLDKFNFYYFWDNKTFGDAFDGCAGTIPEHYWQEDTYSDLTILLYPTYYGKYRADKGSQPIGCTNENGLGNVYLKVAADQYYLGMHEMGHGLYGLMDTYCGDTSYSENNPDANIWSSEDRCRTWATGQSRNPDYCRQITSGSAAGCLKNFWRWDPDPDIMNAGYYGRFGNASTTRILSIMDNYGG